MITSEQIQNLTLDEFSRLYDQCIINEETEKIIRRVIEEQFLYGRAYKSQILLYNLQNISEVYHIPIRENIKTKLCVSSIYIQNKILYIDWSLPSSG